jgi:hypothetical protein
MDEDRSLRLPSGGRPLSGIAVAGAAVILAVVVGGLLMQALGHPRTASVGGLAAALVAALGWSFADRLAGGLTLGGSAAVGGLAVIAAYLAGAAFGGAGSPIRFDGEAGMVVLFSLWLVLPVGVATGLAVGFVFGQRRR